MLGKYLLDSSMRNLILFIILIPLSSFGQNQIISEYEISELAKEISKSVSGRKIANNDITIMRAYSVGRTIACYYNVPNDMQLDKNDVKKQRISQMKDSGFGNSFYKNKINLHMWFFKDNNFYLKVELSYLDFK
jgi:hypothetical protein